MPRPDSRLAASFIPARWYTPTSGRSVRLVVIHTIEGPEKGDSAEATARWFQTLPPERKVSSHYLIDANSIVQAVRERDVAYAAPGANHDGIQLEHAGRARQTKAEWLDEYSLAMLRRSAELTAYLCRKYKLPLRWLSPQDLLAGRRGITSHANVSQAYKRSDHTDPGSHFPEGLYLALVNCF